MRAASLFSGIGAPECAVPDIDWRWSAEIDPFASAVHAARFPGVPNLGDVNRIDPDATEPVDVVVFGSPCQSFSVAGKRLGLDDPRGNLALVALRLVERLRPRWFVFENVPGLLSSDGGRDFGAFLGTVEQCGYGWAYRTLDAQFAGVPQRRRRVFVVGCLGDWRAAAAVLFEPESLRGDTPPRREAGQRIARTLTHGVDSGGKGGYADRRREDDDNLIAFSCVSGTVDDGEIFSIMRAPSGGFGAGHSVAYSLNAHPGRIDGESETFVAHSLRADGFDASEDGTGRGTPLTLAFQERTRADGRNLETQDDIAYALTAPNGGGRRQEMNVANSMSVRRLLPVECEKLQGFPPGWTDITYRDKPAADGPRYRALGNSMAVPVIGWVLDRIREFAA